MDENGVPVVLDTDIGTDVDDVVALGLLLRAPRIDLRAVTTVYVNAGLRARMVKAVLALAGRDDIPVGSGADLPLLKRDPLAWEGWEGEGIVDVALTVDTQAFEQWLVPALAGSPAAWLPG
jgi:purine nucleosidase